MRTTEQTRLIRAGAVCICAGLVYGYLLIPLGLRLRCPFRALTGLRCPGCGITDLCLAVLHGRFWEAPAYNWGVTVSLPALVWLAVSQWKYGGDDARRRQRVCLILAAWLLIWGVIRNFIGL